MKKAILYINQFFGQIGGEDKADFEPVFIEVVITIWEVIQMWQ